jgi:hypothetical protein
VAGKKMFTNFITEKMRSIYLQISQRSNFVSRKNRKKNNKEQRGEREIKESNHYRRDDV